MANKDPMYPGMDDDTDASPDKPKEDDAGNTALLPKDFFEGKDIKPGQQYYVEVVRLYENEVEVKYPHEVKEERATAEADDALESMAKESNPGSNPSPTY